MVIICCKVCRSAPKGIKEGIDETEPLIIEHDIHRLETMSTISETEEKYNSSDGHNEQQPTSSSSAITSKQVYSAKQTLIGMVIVAMGTAIFCTVGAIVQEHGGSVLQLMLGRYILVIFYQSTFRRSILSLRSSKKE